MKLLVEKHPQVAIKMPFTGSDDFKVVSAKDNLCVDTTLFIKAIVESKDSVTLINRPRRFMKSTNMSMAKYFLNCHPNNVENRLMFDRFKIARDLKFCESHQGQYPVIQVSLKSIDAQSLDEATGKFRELISSLFNDFDYLLSSEKLSETNKEKFLRYCKGDFDAAELENGLKNLSSFLYRHHQKKVFIFIDEYDAPLNNAYLSLLACSSQPSNHEKMQRNQNYINDLTLLLRGFLGACLKSNEYLEKGLLTGILRLSKNELLSTLNNLACYGVTEQQQPYTDYFGFSEANVVQLLRECALPAEKIEEIKAWYNGYLIGENNLIIYNPWSVMEYIKKRGSAGPYWARTGGVDKMIQHLLLSDIKEISSKFRRLIARQTLESEQVSEALDFKDLLSDLPQQREKCLWTLLLCSGYLTPSNITRAGLSYNCDLLIPNYEVHINFVEIFSDWLVNHSQVFRNHPLLINLCAGNVSIFAKYFGDYLLKSTSLRDFSAESDYQALMIGLFFLLGSEYQVKSNIEMGLGYPDFIIVPTAAKGGNLGIIIELKHLSSKKADKQLGARKLQLEALAKDEALSQIEDRHYTHAFDDYPHITRVVKIGVAFASKMMVCAFRFNEIGQITAQTEVTLCYGFNEKQLKLIKVKKPRLKRQPSDEDLFIPATDSATKSKASKNAKTSALEEVEEDELLMVGLEEEAAIEDEEELVEAQQSDKKRLKSVFFDSKKPESESSNQPDLFEEDDVEEEEQYSSEPSRN
jgi:hypothetical protein